MARRGENIYKRKDGRWEGRYIKERNSKGKIKYGYIYGSNYSKLKKILIQHKENLKDNINSVVYSGTVSLWLDNWLVFEVKNRVKDSTFATYKYKINRYILPYIGSTKLISLSKESLQTWVDDLLINRNISANTICTTIQILKMSIKLAKKRSYLVKDPTEEIILPRIKKRRVCALSILEQTILEKEAFKNKAGVSSILALYTGLRIGEISALKWTDIDFSLQHINVNRTLQRIGKEKNDYRTQIIIQDVKSFDSERIIPFSLQLKNYLLFLKSESNSPYVISIKEKVMEPRLITYHFRKLLKKVKLQHLHFHQLRHTFATRALEVGGDIASISTLLGHHSPRMTLDIYSHSLHHQRKNITHKIEKKYFKKNIML